MERPSTIAATTHRVVGFDPGRHWVMGIWLGNDDNSPTRASSSLAASLWGEIVRAAG